MGAWFALLVMAAVAWWIWDGSLARERAVTAARRACERHGQQLLDETVQQLRIEWRRTAAGSLLPKRIYGFEFTEDGAARRSGQLAILGRRVLDVYLDLEEFTLIEGSAEPANHTLH